MLVAGVSIFILAGIFIFGLLAIGGGIKEIRDDDTDWPNGILMLTVGVLLDGGVIHHGVLQVFW